MFLDQSNTNLGHRPSRVFKSDAPTLTLHANRLYPTGLQMAGRILSVVLAGLSLGSCSTVNASAAFKPENIYVSPGVSSACAELYQSYPAEVLSPSSSNYTTEKRLFWDARSDLSPACIFQPRNGDEVAHGVKIVSDNDAPFAIRGGGHMNVRWLHNLLRVVR